MSEKTKPPLGVMPRNIYDEQFAQLPGVCDTQRVADILSAMRRYAKVGKAVPQEWVEEVAERFGLKLDSALPRNMTAEYMAANPPPPPYSFERSFIGNGPGGQFMGNEEGGVDDLDR